MVGANEAGIKTHRINVCVKTCMYVCVCNATHGWSASGRGRTDVRGPARVRQPEAAALIQHVLPCPVPDRRVRRAVLLGEPLPHHIVRGAARRRLGGAAGGTGHGTPWLLNVCLGEQCQRWHSLAGPVAIAAGPVAVGGGQRSLAVPTVGTTAAVSAAAVGEIGDPLVGVRLLISPLIRWKPQHCERLPTELAAKRGDTLVTHLGLTSVAGHVDNESDVSFEGRQRDARAVDRHKVCELEQRVRGSG